MESCPDESARLSTETATGSDLESLRQRLEELRTLAKRLEADAILLSGDRDAALRQIAQLKWLLSRALPSVESRAELEKNQNAKALCDEIRDVLR